MKDSKLKSKLLDIFYFINNKYKLWKIRTFYSLPIMSSEQTITHIKKTNCSIARYGDGEFGLMLQTGAVGFQNITDDLSDALKKVFRNTSSNLLICIPYPMRSTKDVHKKGRRFWQNWALSHQKEVVTEIRQYVKKGYVFGDSFVSRLYTGCEQKTRSAELFQQLKQLWEDRDLLFVEGEGTRLGVGNDLFANARSIKRILAPAENAFSVYQEIFDSITAEWNGEMVILALGPTATVLASELSCKGIQALDIGHVDIQYEWFLTGQAYKPVANKYVNEVTGANTVEACEDQQYLSQIVATVRQR